MATISGKIAPSNAYTLTMNVTESNINTTNNTSVVKVVGTITKSGSYGAQNSNGSSNTVVIDGTSYSYNVPFNLYANNSVQIFSQTKTVTHNSDGSKTINVSWTFNGNIGGSYNPNGTVSGSVKLTTIARKSSPSVSPTSVTLPSTSGSTAVTINTNRKSSSFTHTIKLTLGGETISTRTGVGAFTTYSYSELTNLVMPRTTTVSSTTISVSCETFNGSSSLGSNTTSFSVTIGSGAAPSWPAPQWTCLDTNQATIALTNDANLLVQGVSIPVVTITAEQRAEAQYSATMQKYAAQFDGKSYEAAYSSSDVAITLDAPNTHGSQTLSVSAVDSRGLATIASGPMTVLQYNAPAIDASITRAGGYSSEATLSIAGTYSHSDELANTINTTSGVKYRYKRSSESTWSDWINRPVTLETEVSTYAGEQIVPEKPTGAEAETGKYSALDLVLELASEYQWDIEVSCTDSLRTTTVSLTLSVGRPAFYIGSDGRVAVGMQPAQTLDSNYRGHLEVDGTIYSKGKELVMSHVGQVIMTTTLNTAAKVQAVYGGVWESWGAGRVPVGVDPNDADFNAPNKSGGAKTVTLTQSQIPKHKHSYPGGGDFVGVDSTSGQKFGFAQGNFVNLVWKTGGSTAESGSGQAHNNLQPYVAVYMWRRVS